MIRRVLVLAACIATPAFAADTTPPQNDVVLMMQGQYYNTFKGLPPSRKCTVDDAKGAWREFAIIESAGGTEGASQHKEGIKYLAFGAYNRLLWQRSPAQPQIDLALNNSPLQYIVTDAGMFYVYQAGQLQASLLCFVSTKEQDKYKPGMLMLAIGAEKDKPLAMTIYEPLK